MQNSLRTCQLLALNQCKKHNTGIVRMCCGSGKTKIEIKLCMQEKISCLVAPRNALLKQHVNEIKKHVGYTGNDTDDLLFSTDS
jgi:superfamily II DNA or RNA helicase